MASGSASGTENLSSGDTARKDSAISPARVGNHSAGSWVTLPAHGALIMYCNNCC